MLRRNVGCVVALREQVFDGSRAVVAFADGSGTRACVQGSTWGRAPRCEQMPSLRPQARPAADAAGRVASLYFVQGLDVTALDGITAWIGPQLSLWSGHVLVIPGNDTISIS